MTTEIPDQIVFKNATTQIGAVNVEASRVTQEEVQFLLKAMPASIGHIEREIWDEAQRIAYRQLVGER